MKPILYADDEVDDVFFMQRAFEQAEIQHPLQVVSSGEDAIAYLAGKGQYRDRQLFPLPLMLLLDLNMPKCSGFDVLTWLRGQTSFASMPVLVVTSSNQKNDVQRAYLLGANGYFVKPSKPSELLEMVKAFKDNWLTEARLKGTDKLPEATSSPSNLIRRNA